MRQMIRWRRTVDDGDQYLTRLSAECKTTVVTGMASRDVVLNQFATQQLVAVVKWVLVDDVRRVGSTSRIDRLVVVDADRDATTRFCPRPLDFRDCGRSYPLLTQ